VLSPFAAAWLTWFDGRARVSLRSRGALRELRPFDGPPCSCRIEILSPTRHRISEVVALSRPRLFVFALILAAAMPALIGQALA
jgi:hypothetical protein